MLANVIGFWISRVYSLCDWLLKDLENDQIKGIYTILIIAMHTVGKLKSCLLNN